MSLDYMLLAALDGSTPLGTPAVVRERARNALGIDVEQEEVIVCGVRLSLSQAVEDGAVMAIHVTPRGESFEGGLLALARALGAVVFDSQTGRELGVEMPAFPDRVEGDYRLELVAYDLGELGPEEEVWAALESLVGVSRADGRASGTGWSLGAELAYGGTAVSRVILRTRWTAPAARDEMVERVVHCAKRSGWVPFDPQRNDTL